MRMAFKFALFPFLALSFAQNSPPSIALPDPTLNRAFYLNQSSAQLVPLLLRNVSVREYAKINDDSWGKIENAIQKYKEKLARLNFRIRTMRQGSAEQADAIADQQKAKDEFLPELADILSSDQRNRILAVVLAAKGHFEILDNPHLLTSLGIDEHTHHALKTLSTAYKNRMVSLAEDRKRCLASPSLLEGTLKKWKDELDDAYANEEISRRRPKVKKAETKNDAPPKALTGTDLVLSRFRALQEELFWRTDAMMGTLLGFSQSRFNTLRSPNGKPFDFAKAQNSVPTKKKN
jgi:hypothetical protein